MSVSCLPCITGYHFECWNPEDETLSCCCDHTMDIAASANVDEDTKERGGQIKEAHKVKDLQSTGRKRAAKLYPIPKEGQPGYPMKCEWAGLKSAGGGVAPIVGCVGDLAKNIHHGPNKNTLENSVGNVHRICSQCHNRWHTLNDIAYEGERPNGEVPWVPVGNYFNHDGVTLATPEDIANHEMMWINRKLKVVSDDS